MCAIEDALTRWHRMNGKTTLWLPGTDHAGIATQTVVEKKLMREQKKTRRDLGRDKFLEEVWKWKNQSGSHICRQLRRLGSSCDWTREAFTMDEKLNKAVKEAFCRMYEKGLIYRKERLVNWSCRLQTAISQIEVDNKEVDKPTFFSVPLHDKPVEFGVIHKFRYPLKSDPSKYIIVATTRIETMLGDVAVAVHPSDERYKDMVGKEIQHPIIPDRKMTVITDDVLVDPEFGTGAVKITPAHDHNDFECGMRHGLPCINLLDNEGKMNENAGKYKGMRRFVVREKIIEELKEKGLYEGKGENKMVLGFCSRSGDVVEPVLRPQWWVDCDNMAKRSCDAVESGELQILPAFHIKTWNAFMKTPQPWCISRQLWWGHRIPAYFITIDGYTASKEEEEKAKQGGYEVGTDADANFWVAARDEKEAMAKAIERFPKVDKTKIKLKQDEDVLDTWFSSGLFPFSTMGWPDKTADLENYFPGSLLETGHDILFFWVARMVMMSLELTDKLPFKTVFLHAMVRDKLGRKMSKSLGNVVDPIHVMEGVSLQVLLEKIRSGNLPKSEHKKAEIAQRKDFPKGIPECGADALRYGLMTYMKQGKSINLDINVVVNCRHFCNKLWQATKFALAFFDQGFKPPTTNASFSPAFADAAAELTDTSPQDKWILSKLHTCVSECKRGFLEWELATVAEACKKFWLEEFCANYLEMVKPVLYGESTDAKSKAAARRTLYLCIDAGLRLLHPLMPFVTEELWQRLPGRNHDPAACESIMVSAYPSPEASKRWANESVEKAMEEAVNLVGTIRSLRAQVNLAKQKVEVYIKRQEKASFGEGAPTLEELSPVIATLGSASEIKIVEAKDTTTIPKQCLSEVMNQYTVALPLHTVDLGKLSVTYEKKADKKLAEIKDLGAKMARPTYATKTPQDIKDKDTANLKQKQTEEKTLRTALNYFLSVMSPEERKALHESKIKTAEQAVKKYSDEVKKLTDSIPPKEDKTYKKVIHKVGPKLKKAESQLRTAQETLKRLKETTAA
mmetsp:Transcript_34869/g.67419  ORF Transcript_34869/g.67419 Transcript_34869/m.67419 type:complete len:1020 (-) Transcript_34869:166-3225(-)